MKVRVLSAMSVLIAVLIAAGCAPTKAPGATVPAEYRRIRILGTTIGSAPSVAVMALATVLNKHYPEIEWSSASGVSGTNLVYLTKGTEKVGMVYPGAYVDVYGFEKIRESRVRSMNLPRELVHYFFVVPEDKPWKDISEVPRGLALSPGSPGSSTPVAAEAWLKLAGLSKKDFNWLPLGQGQMADDWRVGKLDIAFVTNAGDRAPYIMDMYLSPRKFRPLGLTPEQVARSKAEQTFERIGFEAPTKGTLSQSVPEIFKDDVFCPKQAGFLGSRDDFPEEIAYKMARIIDEHLAELVQIFPPMKAATPRMLIQWARPPFEIHAGVARYYKDKGYLK